MTARDPEGLPAGGTAQAAAGLFEGLLRDWATNGAVLLSLVLAVDAALLTVIWSAGPPDVRIRR